MNYCLLYAAFWIVELLLYSLGWSDINESLDDGLLFLLIITIIISAFAGIRYRDLFRFKKLDPQKYPSQRTIPLCIVAVYFMEFVYCRQVPFISILTGRSDYTSYTGIPIVHILVVTFATYYSFRCYYLYEATGEKNYLKQTILIAGLHLLVYSRVSLLILFFEIVIVKLSKEKLINIIKSGRIVVFAIVIIITLYGFGILGNLRCGYEWNDTTVINAIGQYNDRYPDHLSDQFKWAYTYITSPLANLNNGIIGRKDSGDIMNYCISYVPDFLSKRLFPNYLNLIPDPRIVRDLNAVTGYYNFYYFGGFAGALIMFIVLLGGPIFLLKYIDLDEDQYYSLVLIACELAVFLFFYNVIYLSQCSFLVVYPLVVTVLRKFNYKL